MPSPHTLQWLPTDLLRPTQLSLTLAVHGCIVYRNFALISEQRVVLAPGLNVITGESGSGKSVLIAALSQALGSPANEDFIRSPSDTASVEAVFRLSTAGIVSVFPSRKADCHFILA